ncbi:MAG TPA: NAD(+) kinase [Halieaceae bacterium]|jgi:NAD+ kinase|uniref:NAD(+) kinase n=1 Tax=Haliea TaxID=475794 RepID=UPI000C63EC46|nr:NAD(+) kinase [Haliea sp.]HAN67677.1 NAD(+) kinase [Halieaceae bacterium]MAY94685.1 NAD(+) kinase [Haliea sp.]MBP71689.1 NAD(+) kinase [Haliea sp.]HBM84526.1 NAD(+) kinase [Halieaceae bacterium]HBQ40204.1 NAD(+) kinase [Halieaceae bacterium]|tara:strand:- start:105297 stop:106181 length:885 start_codon:yes stop_codon:yes gene_type:complete
MHAKFDRIGLVGRSQQEGLTDVLGELVRLLQGLGKELVLESRLAELVEDTSIPRASLDEIGEDSDLVIVVGGDGSLLSAARTLAKYETPVLGVNRGRLGFLTDISPDDIAVQVPAVLAGEYTRESRFLLDARVVREGKTVGRADALNDVVVNSGTSAQMIEFELSINGVFVYRQRADGLIISTPTGSTAYSLSGGGPIMHPTLDAVVLVPMFPHALSSRPIVVDGNSEIRLDILQRNRIHPPVTCDGQVNMTARPGDSVLVSKKPHRLTLLHPLGHSFYASCRDKLRWNTALVN